MTNTDNQYTSINSKSSSFKEIQNLLLNIQGPDLEANSKAVSHEEKLYKPVGALGRLETISQWVCKWQGRYPPRLERPRICVFVGNNGVMKGDFLSLPTEVTKQRVSNFINGGAAANQLAEMVDAELRVYEMALEEPTRDFTLGPAMQEDDCVRAISDGMTAVDDGLELLALGDLGITSNASAATICYALIGGNVKDWVWSNTLYENTNIARKSKIIISGCNTNEKAMLDPLSILSCVGGQEISAILGAIIAARFARTPVLLDGYASLAAALILFKLSPELIDHCLVSHCSNGTPMEKVSNKLGKEPLLKLNISLGEATGAVLAINIVRAALVCHNELPEVDEGFGVS